MMRAEAVARTQSALDYKRQRGEKLGGIVPYGMDCRDGVRLVQNQRELATIILIHRLRAQGSNETVKVLIIL